MPTYIHTHTHTHSKFAAFGSFRWRKTEHVTFTGFHIRGVVKLSECHFCNGFVRLTQRICYRPQQLQPIVSTTASNVCSSNKQKASCYCNSMLQNLSWKVYSRPAAQEITRIYETPSIISAKPAIGLYHELIQSGSLVHIQFF
jgi:hypothetical protein